MSFKRKRPLHVPEFRCCIELYIKYSLGFNLSLSLLMTGTWKKVFDMCEAQGTAKKKQHTCFPPLNAFPTPALPAEQPLGHGEWIVPVPNPDEWGHWYCHPFRGCREHVAHPLAQLRRYGWTQAAVAGAVTDVLWSAKANTGSQGGVRVGQSKG